MSSPTVHLVAGPGDLLLAARSDSWVEVWDARTQHRLSAFETLLESGRRPALVGAARPLVVVAGWRARGVAAYDARTGELVWRRRDIQQNQVVHAVGDDVVLVEREGALPLLDAATGETVRSLRGVVHVLDLDTGTGRICWTDGGHTVHLVTLPSGERVRPPLRLADRAPSTGLLVDDRLLLTELKGVLRAVDLGDGAVRWTTSAPRPVTRLLGVRRDGAVLGRAERRDGSDSVLWVRQSDGAVRELRSIDARAFPSVHRPDAGQLLLADGQVLDDSDGSTVDRWRPTPPDHGCRVET